MKRDIWRRLWSVGGIVLIGGAVHGAPGYAAEKFDLLVFSDALPGSAAAYEKCDGERRLPAMLKMKGLLNAQRFILNDPQMYPGVEVKLPQYLTIYEIEARNGAAAAKAYTDFSASSAPHCAGYNASATVLYTYRIAGPSQKRTVPDPKVEAQGRKPKQSYAHIVFTVPQDAMKAQFEQWYVTHHMVDLLTRPGFVSAERLHLVEAKGPVPPTQTAALYRLELPVGMAITEARPAPRPPGSPPHEAGRYLHPNLNRGYSYRAISAVVRPPQR